ncbi:MAG: hypothetical protein K2L00_06495, partial [Muribaculaceae bacterium]|nr:hypothetical protein [Muribaculaceae bacterium]
VSAAPASLPALLVLWHHVIVLNLLRYRAVASPLRAAVGLFPDCGCKITTFFFPPQVFLKSFYVL